MSVAILLIFILGYLLIVLEQPTGINKSAAALLTGVLCWTFYSFHASDAVTVLGVQLNGIAQILFFLLGAMTVVELVDAHDGFDIITSRIKTRKRFHLALLLSVIAFFLSAALDNLTTTIVMVTLIRKLTTDQKDRWLFTGQMIIAANAGGAWSPIGDVTTTMLWIGNQITAVNIMLKLILPSVVCMIIPLLLMAPQLRGEVTRPVADPAHHIVKTKPGEQQLVLLTGIAGLLFVPVFKSLTGLPPFLGMMGVLGLLWMVTEFIHRGKNEAERSPYSVASALQKTDTPGILFFLGILLAVSVLEAAGHLHYLAGWLDTHVQDKRLIIPGIGVLSAVVDNVPLVAATQGMYNLAQFPTDDFLWEFIAYCTGTGGSILIIGSAAGVAAMGMEKIPFFWYLKNTGWKAFAGFGAGALVYLALN